MFGLDAETKVLILGEDAVVRQCISESGTYEDWSYNSNVLPTLQEQNEVIFTFSQGMHGFREIYFDTYETGTMSARE